MKAKGACICVCLCSFAHHSLQYLHKLLLHSSLDESLIVQAEARRGGDGKLKLLGPVATLVLASKAMQMSARVSLLTVALFRFAS